MDDITDEEFDTLISQLMDELPAEYISNLQNVSVVIADEPTEEQRLKLNLSKHMTLFGLYEGVPQTARTAGYTFVLPDKITLFKGPLLAASRSKADFREHVKRTLWHEIAHHYGLDHQRIHSLENPEKS